MARNLILAKTVKLVFAYELDILERGKRDEHRYVPAKKIVIPYDDYHGKYVGKTENGDQFFITTPFTLSGKEFVALYLFDKAGDLKSTCIDSLGSRGSLIGEEAAKILPGNLMQENDTSQRLIEKHLLSLGKISYQDIEVKPFSVEKCGIEFGLIPDDPEDLEEGEEPYYVTLLLGDYMAFYAPWDGEYDT